MSAKVNGKKESVANALEMMGFSPDLAGFVCESAVIIMKMLSGITVVAALKLAIEYGLQPSARHEVGQQVLAT